jgi:hypothetical protein
VFRSGAAARKYVRTREHVLGLDGVRRGDTSRRPVLRGSRRFQYRTLTTRYATVKLRDRVGTAVLLAQAPILAAAMCVVFPQADAAALFMLVLSALWFGASGAVRELIAERPIWKRERRVGVGVFPYLASKVTVLGAMVAAQCFMLTGIVWAWLDMASLGFGLPLLVGFTTLTGLAGMGLGLLLSATFRSSEAAVGSLPLVLIPQIAFGGLIVKVKEMTVLARLIASLTVTRYAFQGAVGSGECLWVQDYGAEPREHATTGVLWELGFRTSAADDLGLPLLALAGILLGFTAVFLTVTAELTRRTGDG